MPTTRIALITALALLAGAPAASAGVIRHAAPGGSGTSCTAASPCSVAQAVAGAMTGDEVIVAPGDYNLTTTVSSSSPIAVHGVAGKPRPRLLFSGPGQFGVRLTGAATLRWIEVAQAPGTDAPALFASSGTLVDQVIARASGTSDTATIQNSTIRNSIAVASGAGGLALTTDTNGAVNTSTYRNVTAIASGADGTAIRAYGAGPAGKATITLVNVIARGFVGLEAKTDSSGAQATIVATHTNYIAPVKKGTYANIVDLGWNQTLAPVFASWQTGDYRQGPGSATMNAGLPDVDNGTLDVDGDPRNLGTVDIGADERISPPGATTGPAGAVTDRSATVSGSVEARGGPTTYRFEYGPTTAYGSATASADAGSGNGAVAAGASLSDLQPSTTYHYRLVATNSVGVTTGADQTLTTAAAPASSPSAPFAGVALVSRRLVYARRSIAVRLRCPAGTTGRCVGVSKLKARVTLGRARFSLAPGSRALVRVRVTRAGRRLLHGAARLRARAVVAARDGAGGSKATRTAVTIRRRS